MTAEKGYILILLIVMSNEGFFFNLLDKAHDF